MHFDNQLKGHSISETQSNGNIIHETPIVPLIVNTHKWKRIPDFIMLKILLIKKFWVPISCSAQEFYWQIDKDLVWEILSWI